MAAVVVVVVVARFYDALFVLCTPQARHLARCPLSLCRGWRQQFLKCTYRISSRRTEAQLHPPDESDKGTGTRTEPGTEVQAVNAPLPEGPHSTERGGDGGRWHMGTWAALHFLINIVSLSSRGECGRGGVTSSHMWTRSISCDDNINTESKAAKQPP